MRKRLEAILRRVTPHRRPPEGNVEEACENQKPWYTRKRRASLLRLRKQARERERAVDHHFSGRAKAERKRKKLVNRRKSCSTVFFLGVFELKLASAFEFKGLGASRSNVDARWYRKVISFERVHLEPAGN